MQIVIVVTAAAPACHGGGLFDIEPLHTWGNRRAGWDGLYDSQGNSVSSADALGRVDIDVDAVAEL